MRIRFAIGFFALFAFAFFDTGFARAQQCELKRYISLDMHESPSGDILVEVMIEHTPRLMIVDTGGVVSEVAENVANELKLPQREIPPDTLIYGVDGTRMKQYVTVHALDAGIIHSDKWVALMAPANPDWTAQNIAGVLAPDFLKNFDLEFDFAAKKLNLFSQDHCEGQVVYWANESTSIPFDLSEEGHINITLSLDGEELRGALDTGATITTLLAPKAHALFGIDENSPGVVHEPDGSLSHVQLHTLNVAGITVQNPTIYLLPDAVNSAYMSEMGTSFFAADVQKRLGPQMLLGTNVLRKLHLYIAYKEHKVYATAVDAH